MNVLDNNLVNAVTTALKGSDCIVQISKENEQFLMRGKAISSKGIYTKPISFQQSVSKEELEEILKLASISNHINTYKKKQIVGFGIGQYGGLTLYCDNKEISKYDLITMYQKYSMEQPKSTLTLEKNLIKLRSLYQKYQDYYEQVTKKRSFLQQVDATSLSGAAELSKFAKSNNFLWLRINGYVPSTEVSLLTQYADIPQMIKDNERISILFEEIPIQDRESYAKKIEILENYSQELIEALERELQSLKKIHERISSILTEIQKVNFLAVKNVNIDLSNMEAKTLEEVLQSVPIPEKYVFIGNSNENRFAANWSKEWAQKLDREQQKNLSEEEKVALSIYKTVLYSPINRIILFMRENNLTVNEVMKTPEFKEIIEYEYNQYKKRCENSSRIANPFRSENRYQMRVYDYVNPRIIIPFESYYQNVVRSLEPLLTAVTKTELTEPLTVYRAEWVDNNHLYDKNYGLSNGLLSTSLSNTFASEFLNNRGSDIANKKGKIRVVYKINLPAGTKIAAFTDSVLLKYLPSNGFQDAQHEILIDGNTLEYTYDDHIIYHDADNSNHDGIVTDVIEVTAKLKEDSYQGHK